jgi:hypothetical protein
MSGSSLLVETVCDADPEFGEGFFCTGPEPD